MIIGVLSVMVPDLPVSPSWPYMLASVLVAMLIGLIAGVLPAWRAAQLDPSSRCARMRRDSPSVATDDIRPDAALRSNIHEPIPLTMLTIERPRRPTKPST